eukprot:1161687-Pelagomonas_calceolata.AAC.3
MQPQFVRHGLHVITRSCDRTDRAQHRTYRAAAQDIATQDVCCVLSPGDSHLIPARYIFDSLVHSELQGMSWAAWQRR